MPGVVTPRAATFRIARSGSSDAAAARSRASVDRRVGQTATVPTGTLSLAGSHVGRRSPVPSRRTLLAGLALLVVAGGVLAVSTAERRALAAEETYVAGRLDDASCLSDWGTREGGGPSADASVAGATAGGVRVRVTLPYAYTTETDRGPVFADTASRAVYEVTLSGTRRIRGDDVSPC